MRIPGKFYLYSDKESSENIFLSTVEKYNEEKESKYEPTENEKYNSMYAGYEVELEGYWQDGNFYVTKFQDIDIVPTLI